MTGRAPRPISTQALEAGLVERVLALRTPAVVLVDGAPVTAPAELAEALVAGVRAAGRSAVHVDTHDFWRDASLRLEYGREDVDSYLDWLDVPALEREVIRPLRSQQPVLPALRDPVSNRSSRVPRVQTSTVVLSGELLLRHDLEADLAVHLAVSASALERRTPEAQTWTLSAFAHYEAESHPATRSDVVVRCDDARHPAVLGLR